MEWSQCRLCGGGLVLEVGCVVDVVDDIIVSFCVDQWRTSSGLLSKFLGGGPEHDGALLGVFWPLPSGPASGPLNFLL